MRLGVWPFVGLLCLLHGCVVLEYGFVSLGVHCFLRLAHALYYRSRHCVASDSFLHCVAPPFHYFVTMPGLCCYLRVTQRSEREKRNCGRTN